MFMFCSCKLIAKMKSFGFTLCLQMSIFTLLVEKVPYIFYQHSFNHFFNKEKYIFFYNIYKNVLFEKLEYKNTSISSLTPADTRKAQSLLFKPSVRSPLAMQKML